MAHKGELSAEQLMAALQGQPTIPLHPHGSQAFGLSRGALYKAVQRGQIPAVRIGGAIRLPTEPIRKMLGIASMPANVVKAA